ncbi:MAG TPA: hypothetical protein VE078_09000 [Thermoanaerobaculia bacterium]|nr:hypothetical protein [Thermoanaerobaculia bacterium]
MKIHDPLTYTETEVNSVLPAGWSLTRDGAGAWDARKKAWQLRILDNVDFDWPVVVKAEDAGALGRFEALRRAMDVVFRERLG